MSSSSKSSRKKPRIDIEEDRARVRFNPFDEEASIAESEPLPAKVILAVTNAKKSTAAACYDSASNKILVFEDSRDDSYDLVEKSQLYDLRYMAHFDLQYSRRASESSCCARLVKERRSFH